MNVYLFIATVLACPVICAQPKGPGSVSGSVISAEDHAPLPGATVLLVGTVRGTTTDATGTFRLDDIPPGEYMVAVSMIGYRRKTAPFGIREDVKVAIILLALEPSPVRTEAMVVTASRREQSLAEVPVSVAVIDDRTLTYRNTITIDDALKYVP